MIGKADALLLLVDSGSLSERVKLPATRRATRDLMERVGAETNSTTGVVWTKDDISVPEAVSKTLETASTGFLPDATTMRTTIKNPDTIKACFSWAIEAATSRRRMRLDPEPRLSQDPFLALRRTHGFL